jgi:DNA-binding SARP family transcriptional activator
MIRWLGRLRRAREEAADRPSKSATRGAGDWGRVEQHENPGETIAALATAVGNHERLVDKLEQAAAAHRLIAKNLRSKIDILAAHQDAEIGRSAPGLVDEKERAFSHYHIVARLLGPFEVSVDGTAVEQWRSQRAASLMKYLLLYQGGPVRREVLMNSFWPFSSASAARNNLNVAVYSLRRTLSIVDPEQPYVIYRDGAYLLNPSLRRWVDVLEYAAAREMGHRCFAAGDLTRAITAYRHARSLYRGSLMEGDVSGEWFRDDESCLRDEHHSVLERLGTALLQHGETNASIDVGRELVSADPCRETGHQLLMRGYAALRQPQLVVRQYRHCVDVLRRELAVEPDAATRALLNSILGT